MQPTAGSGWTVHRDNQHHDEGGKRSKWGPLDMKQVGFLPPTHAVIGSHYAIGNIK